jgi:xylan 1,4-beta-xylosidase
MRLIICILLTLISSQAQDAVTIRVNAAETVGPFKPIYSYFGYDEPNFTYAKNGRKLVGELAALGTSPVYIRTHFMLATGDGTAAFKFGSTNAYTEDASGRPVYDWTIVDRIIDTYLSAGAKPFVEIGFMPKALSANPEPYRPDWAPGSNFDRYYLGWAYPPKDYSKWAELVNQWVRHAVSKYGRSEVESWYWEVGTSRTSAIGTEPLRSTTSCTTIRRKQ